ncbi:CDP-diacylglycerol--glycerol-3-phosphate 3-phosphatidyltransferase [Bacteriovorax stolpii]|uniref:CDP-diacylglycerol--glycerol-3-phosphate 3-phosphatidyltransferase n=1 Tax=Bacteriovorax stolpii TaxID=960 RepID=A0A2K9NSG8_BACTC|nr:CDP-diacylglycerol--glycerol-3-phosphate 3-phosphatidyltransferase [Bacteriovorax stolpii]AUN98466.1 CDP-diacylglycerol--glycerol-3-phosphate 3-phosphatidyltransferase [Bacteriovorax stolpii]TDP50909.1 CDP-diacylglycerol--glycerol-3-phosphate 3-phosphatidyltransferase [Bacteriovorax stolpii]BDT28587.1 CDP-diacylglycerol--glycerol-3-phosphate 3-phosphatidyltransferase [Bacteriovorax sp. HI3]
MSNEWEIDNLPNRLTMFRVILIPIIVFSMFSVLVNYEWARQHTKLLNYVAAWTFVAASITDFLDGFIARRKNIVTVFGSFLDPIADKFLVISALIMLLAMNRVNVLVVLILVLREMYITALRLLAIEKGLSVPVGALGKWKTATQMVGVPLLMAYDVPWGIDMPLIGTILIYLASIFSLYSAVEYSLGLVGKIQKIRKEKKRKKNIEDASEPTT